MSMRRTFGAMPTITARQMATESFAVPKSVINTITGLLAGAAVASFAAGTFAQPTQTPRKMNRVVRNDLFCSRRSMSIPRISSNLVYAFHQRSLVYDERVGVGS